MGNARFSNLSFHFVVLYYKSNFYCLFYCFHVLLTPYSIVLILCQSIRVVSGEKNIWAIRLINYLLFMFFVEQFMCFLYFSHEPKAAFLCFFLCWDMVSSERGYYCRDGICPKTIRALSSRRKRIGSQKVSFSYCIYARGISPKKISRVVFIFFSNKKMELWRKSTRLQERRRLYYNTILKLVERALTI